MLERFECLKEAINSKGLKVYIEKTKVPASGTNARQFAHLGSTLVVFVNVEWDTTLSSVQYVESGPTIAAQDCKM